MFVVFYESSMWLVKWFTCDFESETSSVNEAHNIQHTQFSELFSNVMKSTHNTYNISMCWKLNQIIISIVFNNVKIIISKQLSFVVL